MPVRLTILNKDRLQRFPGVISTWPGWRMAGFLALSRRCTHLGCTVPWNDEKQVFLCPCHASTFDIQGEVLSPPAHRAMALYRVVIENNRVKVDTRDIIKRHEFEIGQVVYPSKI